MALQGGRTYVFLFDPLAISILNVAKSFCAERGQDAQVSSENVLTCISTIHDFLKSQIQSLHLSSANQIVPDFIEVCIPCLHLYFYFVIPMVFICVPCFTITGCIKCQQ